jgi:hypothetical protein
VRKERLVAMQKRVAEDDGNTTAVTCSIYRHCRRQQIYSIMTIPRTPTPPVIMSSHRRQDLSGTRYTHNHARQCSPRMICYLDCCLQAENLCSGRIFAPGPAGSEDPEMCQGTRPCLPRTWKPVEAYHRLYSGAGERWPQEVRVVVVDIGQ